MSTKLKRGEFDCWNNAMDDEEMFILLGRDKMSGALVRLWAEMREREGEDPAVVKDARECADRLDNWAKDLGKPVITFDALISFASMTRDQRMESRTRPNQQEAPPEIPKVEWKQGEHAMTAHSRHIGIIERVIDPSDTIEAGKPRLVEPMAVVRFGRGSAPTIPLANLRKPTTEEVQQFYDSRWR